MIGWTATSARADKRPEVLEADASLLPSIGVEPGRYAVVIAHPEPENSVLDIVRAFSRQPRGYKLVMLGRYEPGQCADLLETLWNDDQAIASMRIASKKRFLDEFTWTDILGQYEALLGRWTAAPVGSAPEFLSR